MMEKSREALGREMVKKCYGDVVPMPGGELDSYQRMTLEGLFAEVWSREGTSFRDKRIAVLGVLAGTGADPELTRIHVRSALANGELSPEELRELVLIVTPYCGYPKGTPIYQVVEACIKEREDAR